MKKIALIVGHTARMPGATATYPLNQTEYDYNKGLAGLIACHIHEKSPDVECQIFFRDGIGIAGAYQEVNAYGASIAVELHFNASMPSGVGTETLYVPKVVGSKALAVAVQQAIALALGRTGSFNRGAVEIGEDDRGYFNLTQALCPSCLAEPFFGTHAGDAALGQSEKSKIAEAIGDACLTQLQTT